MKRRKVVTRTRAKLESLTTPRLLAILKQLHRCEDSIVLSDREPNSKSAPGSIEFKNSPEWITEYDLIKDILSHREHVPAKDR